MANFRYRQTPTPDAQSLALFRKLRSGDQTQNDPRLEMQKRALDIREELGQGRLNIQQQNMELLRMKEAVGMMKAQAAIRQQMVVQQQTAQALQRVGKLDSTSPNFHADIAQIFHDNPLATNDKMVQDLTRDMIHTRQVKETTGEEIIRHEESQASEFSRIHGVNIVRSENGRVDWAASQKAADEAAKQKQAEAVAGVDPSLKPTETKIVNGVPTQVFRAATPATQTTTTTTRDDTGAKTTVTTRGPVLDKVVPPPPSTAMVGAAAGINPQMTDNPAAASPSRIRMKFQDGQLVPAE